MSLSFLLDSNRGEQIFFRSAQPPDEVGSAKGKTLRSTSFLRVFHFTKETLGFFSSAEHLDGFGIHAGVPGARFAACS